MKKKILMKKKVLIAVITGLCTIAAALIGVIGNWLTKRDDGNEGTINIEDVKN